MSKIYAKNDYLTLSLLPGTSGWDVNEGLTRLLKALLIEDWLPWFVPVASNSRYDEIMRFNDVSLKIPSALKFEKQGICIEFSGNGIEYYREYLHCQRGVTDKTAFKRFISMVQFGCKTKCSRFDWAIDEQSFGLDQPSLRIDTIQESLLSHNFVSLFRKADPENVSGELQSCYSVQSGEIDKKIPFNLVQSMDISSGVVGKTIYLGKRKSGTYVRFYDKLAEQIAHKSTPPDGCKSWVRFEMEFHQKNASAVFLKYVTDSAEDFRAFVCGFALRLIRFVDPGRSRRYNCVTSKWWLDFLQTAKKSNIAVHSVKHNKFLNFLVSFKRQYAAVLAAVASCDFSVLASILKEGLEKHSKTSDILCADYKALSGLPPNVVRKQLQEIIQPLSGEEYWRSFTDFSKSNFSGWLSRMYREVFHKEVGVCDC